MIPSIAPCRTNTISVRIRGWTFSIGNNLALTSLAERVLSFGLLKGNIVTVEDFNDRLSCQGSPFVVKLSSMKASSTASVDQLTSSSFLPGLKVSPTNARRTPLIKFDFPHPFRPTIPTRPGSKLKVVSLCWQKFLNRALFIVNIRFFSIYG